jgi:hypothetical protein
LHGRIGRFGAALRQRGVAGRACHARGLRRWRSEQHTRAGTGSSALANTHSPNADSVSFADPVTYACADASTHTRADPGSHTCADARAKPHSDTHSVTDTHAEPHADSDSNPDTNTQLLTAAAGA